MSETVSIAQRDNRQIADKLNAVAVLLDNQNANRFRVRAYEDAAAYVAGLTQPVSDIFAKGGIAALEDLPTIGPSIAAAIMEILQTGDLRLLTTLRGDQDPEKLLQTVPQIGRELGVDPKMIAAAGEFRLERGDVTPWGADVNSSMRLGS